MELKILVLLSHLAICFCKIQSDVVINEIEVNFVLKVIQSATSSDPTRVHDIVFIPLELHVDTKTTSNLIASMSHSISADKNAVILPNNQYRVKSQRIRPASIIVIVSDVFLEVRFLQIIYS